MAALLLAAVQAEPAPLDWLAGSWSCRAEMPARGPAWRFLEISRDGAMLSARFGRRAWRDGKADMRPEGWMRIGRDRLILTYEPDNDVASEYRLVRSDREGAVFETRERTIPQRIAFRPAGAGLTVTMSQLDGSLATITSYSPPGMHTGIGPCRE